MHSMNQKDKKLYLQMCNWVIWFTAKTLTLIFDLKAVLHF